MQNLSQEDIIKIIKHYEDNPQKIHGKGVIAYLSKKFLKPKRDGYTNVTKKTLEQYGNTPIVSMEIYRTPLHNILTKAVNFISLGKFEEMQRKLGYDKFFHLALVLTLNNNKKIIIQKLDVIEVSTNFKTKDDTEVENVSAYNPASKLTINQLFANARKVVPDDLWFGYDGLKNNCQWFVKYLLENSGLYGANENEFVFQNLEELIKEMPEYVGDTMNFVTDAAATYTNLTGKGHYKLHDIRN
jgi:hypothetical protein